MKALLLAVASMIFSSQTNDDSRNRAELTDSFKGFISSIIHEGQTLTVAFQGQNSLYRLSLDHPQFAEIKAKLEKAKKIDQKLKVVAIIPSMVIKEING